MIDSLNRATAVILLFASLGLPAVSIPLPALAQPLPTDTGKPASEQTDAQSGLEAEGRSLLEQLRTLGKDIQADALELRKAEGEEHDLLKEQLVRSRISYRRLMDKLLKNLEAQRTAGLDPAALQTDVRSLVKQESPIIRREIESAQKTITALRTDRDKAAPEERLKIEQRLIREAARSDDLLEALLVHTERMNALGLDAQQDLDYLDALLESRSKRIAGRIEHVVAQIRSLKERSRNATEEEKKTIAGELLALEEKKQESASSLAATVDLMAKRGLDTSAYSQLLITTTGEITADIFDTQVAAGLLQQWFERGREWTLENGPAIILKTVVIIFILLVFKMFANLVGRMVRRGVTTSRLSLSLLLQDFFVSLASKAVMAVGVLVALSQLGVQIGPLLAGLGVVGFIVGFALQDTLSNFASGLMILIYRPYDVGNVIEAGGVMGKVQQMSLVSTTVMTPDNQKLVVPNNKIWGGVIRNVTAQENRRVDLTFGIGYGDDIAHAERVLKEIVEAHPLVLPDPEPVIKLHALGESSVDFVVRPWARTGDYWTVYWDITRSVKERFDAEGISIPFPQRDVHLHQVSG